MQLSYQTEISALFFSWVKRLGRASGKQSTGETKTILQNTYYFTEASTSRIIRYRVLIREEALSGYIIKISVKIELSKF